MDEYLSPAQAADAAAVSVDTIRRRIADGTLPAVRFGRLVRIPRNALAELGRPINNRRTAS